MFLSFLYPLINMIFFPGDLIEPDGFEKFYDILPAIIMRLALPVLRNENNRHVGKKGNQLMAQMNCPAGILGDLWLYGNDGKSNALFDDDGSVE